MILFFGRLSDPPMQLAVDAASDAGADVLVVDQLQSAYDDVLVTLGPEGLDGLLVVGGQRLPLADITAAYARPLAPVYTGGSAEARRAATWQRAIVEWLDVAPGRIVNRPAAMSSNASKPFQAQHIAPAFAVPETLVTSDPDEARAFWQEHGDVVYKSTSGVRSIVRRLDEASASRLDRVTALPTQFQACVPGVDVRVHVVGQSVFAAEIRSEAVDYRYAQRDGQDAELVEVELPADVAVRCVQLAEHLQLPFCGIDLRRRPDGEYVCFEVNPMPGYSWFETQTGLPISAALVSYLRAEAA